MNRLFLCAVLFLQIVISSICWGQNDSAIDQALRQPVIEPDLPWHEVQDFTETRVLPMPEVSTVAAWEKYIEGRRAAALKDVVLRGAAAGWRDAQTKVEWLDTIDGGPGYKIRKLRYEAIPGLWVPALLYVPDKLEGKVPVVLNVNGHDGNGKAADYKQIRCINQAKRGMLALNVEWFGMGQLRSAGFNHYKSNQIDLCGTSGVALHYLYMTCGLDILLDLPNADPKRVAVAGLSGGGWQTIFVSALDQRVTLSNPVAGYSSYVTRARHTSDLGDSEQTPVDLAVTADYNHLTAMRAPRPTLLTFNAQDQCCFRADHALDPLMQASQPIFDLYGKGTNLRSHVNSDPGSHNFLLDNRQQLYKMLRDHFFAGAADDTTEEIESESEVKSAETLSVELPEGNLDFHQIALNLMQDLPVPHAQSLEGQRTNLRQILRYEPFPVTVLQSDKIEIDGVSAKALRLKLGSEWTVPATWLTPAGEVTGAVLLIADAGRASAAKAVEQQLQSGKQVVAVDPFYFGESKISQRDFLYALLVSSVGKRPLGIQAAQVAAVAEWMKKETGAPVELQAIGPRTGLVADVSAAVNPGLFIRVSVAGGYHSLKEIIERDLDVSQAPELFCFGLLEAIDVPTLKSLATP